MNAWVEYYLQHPFDDLHRYHRPAALIARSGTSTEIPALLDWLQPKAKGDADLMDSDTVTLAAFGAIVPAR